MTPANQCDPLAYEPGDRVGLCLDLDGTVYRSGSVFLETLAYLPYADAIGVDGDDRRQLREVVAAVAEYRGGATTRMRWLGTLGVLDVLRRTGFGPLSERLLSVLLRVQARRVHRIGARADYRRMQGRVLGAYGAFLRGRTRRDVERVVEAVVETRLPVDRGAVAAIDRLDRAAGAETYLVTDVPDHIARAYARRVTGRLDRVVATTFRTDDRDRFSGEFDLVEKGAAVERLRTDRDWDYVVAAGDSTVDLGMASTANLFFLVESQGDIGDALPGSVPLGGDASEMRRRLRSGSGVVRVERDEDLGRVMVRVLSILGVC